jgi:hypothetical protein
MMIFKKKKSSRFNRTSEDARLEKNSSQENTITVSFSNERLVSNKTPIEYLSDEPGLEFKEDLVFPDGTVFKGQVKDG